MATKGRTGNKKAIAAANAKKKASYDSKLKSYNDSTSSYQNEIKKVRRKRPKRIYLYQKEKIIDINGKKKNRERIKKGLLERI